MIFNLPGLSDIEALKSAELYEGNIDSAPLGLCRMNAGAIAGRNTDIVVFTFASNAKKWQFAVEMFVGGTFLHRTYNTGAWGAWVTLPRKVVDNLTTTSYVEALSANQGNVLKGLIDGLKSAELFTGSIDNAPLGLCRMSGGAVAWTAVEIMVITIQINSVKHQFAFSSANAGEIRRRYFTGSSWNYWVTLPNDVVNNLTDNNITKALSAAQGKALNDKIDGLVKVHIGPETDPPTEDNVLWVVIE